MSRLPDPTKKPTPEVAAMLKEMEQERGVRIDGMYRTMLNHLALTKQVSELGAFLRYKGELPDDLREALILFTARKLKVAYEWVKHVSPARKANVPEAFIEALKEDRLNLEDFPQFAPVLNAAEMVLKHKMLPEDLQESLIQQLGIESVIEIVTLVGFYTMIAGIITAFDVPLPEGDRN